MERRSRSTSVRLSKVFLAFKEGQGLQKDHQPDLPLSKREKNFKEKVGLFSFRRRAKSEGGVTERNKSTRNLKQPRENEMAPSVPLQNCGEEDSVHCSDGGGRFQSQTYKTLSSKDYNHAKKTSMDVMLRDKQHFSVKITKPLPRESLNQQEKVSLRGISPTERKRFCIDTRMIAKGFRFSLKETEGPSAEQGFINNVQRNEKCMAPEARMNSSLSPVLAKYIPVCKSAFLDIFRGASVETDTRLQSLATSPGDKGNKEAQSLVVPNKEGRHPESLSSNSCRKTNLDDCESSKITGSKMHSNKLTPREKSRFAPLRRLIWLMFFSIISLPYCLYSWMRSVFIWLVNICKSSAYAAAHLVQSAFQGFLTWLRSDKQLKEVELRNGHQSVAGKENVEINKNISSASQQPQSLSLSKLTEMSMTNERCKSSTPKTSDVLLSDQIRFESNSCAKQSSAMQPLANRPSDSLFGTVPLAWHNTRDARFHENSDLNCYDIQLAQTNLSTSTNAINKKPRRSWTFLQQSGVSDDHSKTAIKDIDLASETHNPVSFTSARIHSQDVTDRAAPHKGVKALISKARSSVGKIVFIANIMICNFFALMVCMPCRIFACIKSTMILFIKHCILIIKIHLGFKEHSATMTPSSMTVPAIKTKSSKLSQFDKLLRPRDSLLNIFGKCSMHEGNVDSKSDTHITNRVHEMNLQQEDIMKSESEKTSVKKIALMFKKLRSTNMRGEGKVGETSGGKKQYAEVLMIIISKILHALSRVLLFLPLQMIRFFKFISCFLKLTCRSLLFFVKTTSSCEGNSFNRKQGEVVPKEDQLQMKAKAKFSRFIRQISQSPEQASMNPESTEGPIPENTQRLSSDMEVKSIHESVMPNKNRPSEFLKTNGARTSYIKSTFHTIAANVKRLVSRIVLCLLQLLWIIAIIPCSISTFFIKTAMFIVRLPYVILLSSIKLILVLAKVFQMSLSCILLVPIRLLNMLFVLLSYIFTKFGKVCGKVYQHISRIVINKRKHLEGKTKDFEKTSDQWTQVSIQQLTPSLPPDLEYRNKQLSRESTSLLVKLNSKKDGAWKSSDLLKESANVELDFEDGKLVEVFWHSPTQIARKLVAFSEDFFIYLFFLSLLPPISLIAFLKPVISFVVYICKVVALCQEDSGYYDIFNDENVTIDSCYSNEQGSQEQHPSLGSELHHTNVSDGKACRIYGLVNLRRKFKKLSKKNLEPGLLSNENMETESPVIIENIIRRSPSFLQRKEPAIKLQEKDVEECPCDPRPYIRRFLTFLRISFHLLSIFIANLSHRVSAVLQTSLYHFARTCKMVISFVIHLTPRRWLKRLLIWALHYLPDLRNRSLQLQILKATPSRVSKKLVEIYMRRVPLSVMYFHVQASLRDSPSKKLIQNLAKIWTSVKLLLETAFLTVSAALKMVSRSLKMKRKPNVVKTKSGSLLRLISKDASNKDNNNKT